VHFGKFPKIPRRPICLFGKPQAPVKPRFARMLGRLTPCGKSIKGIGAGGLIHLILLKVDKMDKRYYLTTLSILRMISKRRVFDIIVIIVLLYVFKVDIITACF